MSTKSHNFETENCQHILAAIYDSVAPFHTDLESVLSSSNNTIDLKLTGTQISLLASLFSTSGERKIVIAPSEEDSVQLSNQINSWQDHVNQDKHSKWSIISAPLTEQEISADVVTDLSIAYHNLLNSSTRNNIVLSSTALTEDPPDVQAYSAATLRLTTGQQISLKKLSEHLTHQGFTRHRTAIEPGTMRIRGEAIDIKHPMFDTGYYTITLFGNNVESITHTVARRSSNVKSVSIPPMKFPEKKTTWENIVKDSFILRPESYSELIGDKTIIVDSPNPQITYPIQGAHKSSTKKQLFLLYQNRDHLDQYIDDHSGQELFTCQSPLAKHPIHIESDNWVLRTETHIFPPEQKGKSPISYERALELIGELEVGKPAVHADHGIGIYEGLQHRSFAIEDSSIRPSSRQLRASERGVPKGTSSEDAQEITKKLAEPKAQPTEISGFAGIHRRQVDEPYEKEYLVLRYAEGDSLSVPVEYAHKVSAYIGESTPQIYRLGGTLWRKTKKRAQADAAALAKELLEISQKRNIATRTRYSIDEIFEKELDETFSFDLTDDQARTWKEIKHDLQQDIPMDRLIVGDVGFGKTEMAIRAAYHAIQNGKQVAVLAPTTLLVQQHYDTFVSRLPKIADNIHLLSRFVSKKDQDNTKKEIQSGKAKIVIGTHAILSKSIQWKNLSLVVIDEEQRFGVTQKEHFKKIRSTLDILSLSATPIPRTLSMALSGLRTLSLITTAPKRRKDVKTFVKKTDDTIIQEAIQRELDREGQTYIVAPKIRHLASIKEHITALFPNASMAIAHARLPDKQLSEIIHQFDSGELDILISSTIVENGLDLEGANTMIVWHSPNLGLSELYQLRGRIGRRQRQGYAYFLYNQERLSGIQRERLTAITEASRLGSGWELARRDLEMRGAGNMLGAEQSGSVGAVGLQLYLDMVNQQIEPEGLETDTSIQLPISSTIPTHYIQDTVERTRWYKRLARARNAKQLEKQTSELQSTYGNLPEETQNLVLLIRLQQVAKKFNISKISSKTISPPDEDPYERLILESRDLPRILKKVSALGNWQVRQSELTWNIDDITPSLIEQIINALQ